MNDESSLIANASKLLLMLNSKLCCMFITYVLKHPANYIQLLYLNPAKFTV